MAWSPVDSSTELELTYSFTSNKPWKSRIIPSDSSIYPTYSVKTRTEDASSFFGSSHNVTEVISESSGQTIATLIWRETLPDKVTFKRSTVMSMNTWMKPSLLNSHHAAFSDERGRKYQWRNIAAGLNMVLYAEDAPDTPIAACTKGNQVSQAQSANLQLKLTQRATEIYELCVVSFIFLEKKRSLKEIATLSRAEVAGKEGFLLA